MLRHQRDNETSEKSKRFPAREQMPRIDDINKALEPAGFGFVLPKICNRTNISRGLFDKVVNSLGLASKRVFENHSHVKSTIALLRAITILLVDDQLPYVDALAVTVIIKAVRPLFFFGSILNPTPRNSKSRHLDEDVRFNAILVVDALARNYAGQLLGEWASVLPETAEAFERDAMPPHGNLFTVVLHDTHTHAQLAACNCIISVLCHARKFVATTLTPTESGRTARTTPSLSSFTSRSEKIREHLLSCHVGALNALQTLVGYDHIVGAVFRVLQQVIITTPYNSCPDSALELVTIFKSDEFLKCVERGHECQVDAMLTLRNTFLCSYPVPGIEDYLRSPQGIRSIRKIIAVCDMDDDRFEDCLKCLYSLTTLHSAFIRGVYWEDLMRVFEVGMRSPQEAHQHAVVLGLFRIAGGAKEGVTEEPSFTLVEWSNLYKSVILPSIKHKDPHVASLSVKAFTNASPEFLLSLSEEEWQYIVTVLTQLTTLKSKEALCAVCRCTAVWSQKIPIFLGNAVRFLESIVQGWRETPTPQVSWGLTQLVLAVHKAAAPISDEFIGWLVQIATESYDMTRNEEKSFPECGRAVHFTGVCTLLLSSASSLAPCTHAPHLTRVQCILATLDRGALHSDAKVRRGACKGMSTVLSTQHRMPSLLLRASELVERDEVFPVRGEAAEVIAASPEFLGTEAVVLSAVMGTIGHLDETQYFEQYRYASTLGPQLCRAFVNVVVRTYPWHPYEAMLQLLRKEFALLAGVLDLLKTYDETVECPAHVLKDLHLVLSGKYR